MAMPKMSPHSTSFLRGKSHGLWRGTGILKNYIRDVSDKKQNILNFMRTAGANRRAVYFAENLKIKTEAQLLDLLHKLTDRLHAANIDAVIEFHTQSDQTSKSAHIHFWGRWNEDAEQIITNFIKSERLSNKEYLNYTDPEIDIDTKFERVKRSTAEEVIDVEIIEEADPENSGYLIGRYTFEKDPETGKNVKKLIGAAKSEESKARENAAALDVEPAYFDDRGDFDYIEAVAEEVRPPIKLLKRRNENERLYKPVDTADSRGERQTKDDLRTLSTIDLLHNRSKRAGVLLSTDERDRLQPGTGADYGVQPADRRDFENAGSDTRSLRQYCIDVLKEFELEADMPDFDFIERETGIAFDLENVDQYIEKIEEELELELEE